MRQPQQLVCHQQKHNSTIAVLYMSYKFQVYLEMATKKLCVLCVCQCFNAIGWATGKVSSLYKVC